MFFAKKQVRSRKIRLSEGECTLRNPVLTCNPPPREVLSGGGGRTFFVSQLLTLKIFSENNRPFQWREPSLFFDGKSKTTKTKIGFEISKPLKYRKKKRTKFLTKIVFAISFQFQLSVNLPFFTQF